MKHPVKITLVLLGLFVVSQLVGLALISSSVTGVVVEDDRARLSHKVTALGETPDFIGQHTVPVTVENGTVSVENRTTIEIVVEEYDDPWPILYLIIGVTIGTLLLLVLIKFRQIQLWKLWFFLAVFLAQAVAFGVVLSQLVALILAFVLGLLKVYKPNPWVHNITEVFMYAGIAVLLVPNFTPFWVISLLLVVSLYDAWAVWRSRHMIKLAEFQKSSDVFAGLLVPKKTKIPKPIKKSASKTAKKVKIPPQHVPPPKMGGHAILGGGDIAFPLIFAGVFVEDMLLKGAVASGLTITSSVRNLALVHGAVILLGALVALALLFFYAKKDRYYPAMPYITAGCLAGWLVTFLL